MSSPIITPTQEPAAPSTPPPKAGGAAPAGHAPRVRQVVLRKNYDLFYWWAVWVYAAFAAVWTQTFGVNVKMVDAGSEVLKAQTLGAIDARTVKVFTEPWLAIGFLSIVLFVAVFTAVRARGAMSMVLVLTIFAATVIVSWTLTWTYVFAQLPLLRLYMNQGVYVTTFVVLLPIWLLTTFGLNRLHYYRFRPGRQVADVRPFGGGEVSISSHTLSMHKLADDIFVHRVLGLWPLGLGTGDIEIGYTKPDGSAHKEIIHNVLRPHAKIRAIQELMR